MFYLLIGAAALQKTIAESSPKVMSESGLFCLFFGNDFTT